MNNDPAAERIILSGLLNFGSDIFYDLESILSERDFFHIENKLIFTSIANLITKQKVDYPDVSSVLANIEPHHVTQYDLGDYLEIISRESIHRDNVFPFAQTVARLALSRKLRDQILSAASSLESLDGSESIKDIIAMAEKPIIDFTSSLIGREDLINFGDFLDDYVEYVKENKDSYKGVPTGFRRWDAAIGGGLRRPGVHLVGARAKVGKSFFCVCVANYVTANDIPVLYLDTELTKEMVMARFLASVSGVDIDDLEDGVFLNDESMMKKVQAARKDIAGRRFFYQNISGHDHTYWISVIRKWIMREVGFRPDGSVNDCLIILDYIKDMGMSIKKNLPEWMYLGQVINDLHNLAIQFNLPMLSMAQLNRQGINNSDQGILAGSDKLLGLCSSFSTLRIKNQDDLADDPINNSTKSAGDRKIEVIATRFGKGLGDGEYINLWTDLSKSIMTEGLTNVENRRRRSSS